MSRTGARVSSAARDAIYACQITFMVVSADEDSTGIGYVVETPLPVTRHHHLRTGQQKGLPIYVVTRFGRRIEKAFSGRKGYSLIWDDEINHRFDLHIKSDAMAPSILALRDRTKGLPRIAILLIESAILQSQRDVRHVLARLVRLL